LEKKVGISHGYFSTNMVAYLVKYDFEDADKCIYEKNAKQNNMMPTIE
jgi:hypothetical protein